MNFPKDFIWGAATASYQVEGAVNQDGRQESVWDEFSHWNGKVKNGENGDIACDHYNRYKEDVQLMSDLKIPNYRFSVAWPRILSYDSDCGGGPVHGKLNQKGLDFYDRLVDELLSKNIDPWLTLFHWDLPLELERKGGWRNRDIRYWAAEYTEIIAKKFAGRVKHFMTLNEMPCILGGYMGWMAPGLVVSQRELLNITHNILLTHGTMAKVLRENTPAGTQIGTAHCSFANFPATDSAEDIEAFNKSMEVYEADPIHHDYRKGSGIYMSHCVPYWCDPIFLGHYPAGAEKIFGKDFPKILPGDMELISTPLDFHGQNIYEGRPVTTPKNKEDMEQGFTCLNMPQGAPQTHSKWEITPRSMRHFVKWISDRYNKPVYITENGLSTGDYVSSDGKCHDPERIDFTRDYLTELGKAIEDGANIKGYFHWSLMDNFEWARGYGERFGLVHVDYQTQKRTVKDSALWYSKVIQSNKVD